MGRFRESSYAYLFLKNWTILITITSTTTIHKGKAIFFFNFAWMYFEERKKIQAILISSQKKYLSKYIWSKIKIFFPIIWDNIFKRVLSQHCFMFSVLGSRMEHKKSNKIEQLLNLHLVWLTWLKFSDCIEYLMVLSWILFHLWYLLVTKMDSA